MARYTQFTSYMRFYKGEYASDVERARRFVERRGLTIHGRLVGFIAGEEPEYHLKLTMADGTKISGIYNVGRTDATGFVLQLMYRARQFNNFPEHRDAWAEGDMLARKVFDTQYARLVFPKRTFMEKLRRR